MMPDSINNICITGMGMVASIGYDVITCCAAARAGIVRSTGLDYFPVLAPDDWDPLSLTVHQASLVTEGFEGKIRLLRLAHAGLVDLQRQVPDAPWTHVRTAFYLSLPDPLRVHSGLSLIEDEKNRQSLTKKAQEAAEEPLDKDMPSHLIEEAVRLSGWRGESLLKFVTTSGHTGVAEVLRAATVDLYNGQVEMAVIGGVDSLLDKDTLWWLKSRGRLKTPDVPAGLQPGEAGAFILIETSQSARARGARVFGNVQDVRLGDERKTLLEAEVPIGAGLVEVLASSAKSAGWTDEQTVWIISDQNGEPYRAIEWGNVVVRLVAKYKAFEEPVLWCPAVSFGDTGAASGAVSLCVATSAFDCGYMPARTVAIVSSSDGTYRTAILLTLSNKQV